MMKSQNSHILSLVYFFMKKMSQINSYFHPVKFQCRKLLKICISRPDGGASLSRQIL